jgi:ribosomal protein S18 acetylase RimI-like enzyme
VLGDTRAVRIDPEVGVFAAAANASPASVAALTALCRAHPGAGLVEREDGPMVNVLPQGAEVISRSPCVQMVCSRTHRLGGFIGVKRDGRLAAMAGRRLRVEGHTELSGVCTHPDFRGHGLATALSRRVVAGILAEGDKAFLHAYAAHDATIALYESLGFRTRARVIYTVLA